MSKLAKKFHGLKILFKFDNKVQLLINRLLFPSGGPTIYRLDGLEVVVDHSAGDHNGTRECLVPGLYDPCLEAIAPTLPANLTVLDLGANGGGFLLALKRLGWSIRRAVTVELNPHTHSRLALNILRNIPNSHECVRMLNGAAGANDGKLSVTLGRGSVGDSIYRPDEMGHNYELPCYSLQTLCEYFPESEEIDLCKIDIEGAEYDLINNADPKNFRRIRNIIIEIHDEAGDKSDDLANRIVAFGFERVIPSRPLLESTVFLFRRVL